MRYYDLETIEELCQELGFPTTRSSEHELEVIVIDDTPLLFMNLPDVEDTAIGFRGTPWHAHDKLSLMTGKSTYITLDELDVVQGIYSGDILVHEWYLNGKLEDRWLGHRHEPVDCQYFEPGEEMRIRRRP